MKSSMRKVALVATILATVTSLVCSPKASVASPFYLQETEAKAQKDDSKDSDDMKSAKKAFSSLAQLVSKKNYSSASKLMTQSGFDEFCASKIIEAGMMTDERFAPASTAEKITDVFDTYNIDLSDLPDPFEGGMPSPDEQQELNEKLLSGFKDMKQRLTVLKELESAMKPEEMEADGIIINVSLFDGEVVGSSISGNVATLEIKPTLPEGMEMMMAGPDGELPEGVEIFDADELPPGAMQAEGIPVDEIPEGVEMHDMMIGDMPSMFFRLKKEEGKWKWDGIDKKKTEASHEAMAMDLDIPTIEDPEFKGTSLAGNEVSLKDYKGKLVLVDFWGTWCKPCVAELPKLKKLHKALKEHGFEIIGVANDQKEDLEKFMEKTELPWVNIVDGNGKICEKFGVRAFPTTLLIDQEGNHVASNLRGKKLMEELAERLDLNEEAKKALQETLKPKRDRKRSKRTQF